MRIGWIDIAKGIGILLVMVGHSSLGNHGYVGRWICSFHMPLFFLLAGYCFDSARYSTFGGYFVRKLQALGYPLVTLVFLQACIGGALYFGVGKYSFTGVLQHATLYNVSNVMWFVQVLLLVEVSYWLLWHFLRYWSIVIAACLAIAVDIVHLHFCLIDVICVSLLFYALGHCCRQKCPAGKFLSGDFCLIGCFLLTFGVHLAIAPRIVDDACCYVLHNIGLVVLYAPLAVIGSGWVFLLSMLIDRLDGRMRFLRELFVWLGNSIILLAIHTNLGAARQTWGLPSCPSRIIEIILLLGITWLLAGPLHWYVSWGSLMRLLKKK